MFARRVALLARAPVPARGAAAAAPAVKPNAELAKLEEKAKGPWKDLSKDEKLTRAWSFFPFFCSIVWARLAAGGFTPPPV